MSAECNGCGACCDPVVLPYTQRQVAGMLPDEYLTADERRFVLEDLTPITRRDGMARASYLSAGVTVMGQPGSPESVVLAWSAFYTCRHYDPETRRCGNYANRPRMCREYPWYGDGPDPAKALPGPCAYRADRGETPEEIPG